MPPANVLLNEFPSEARLPESRNRTLNRLSAAQMRLLSLAVAASAAAGAAAYYAARTLHSSVAAAPAELVAVQPVAARRTTDVVLEAAAPQPQRLVGVESHRQSSQRIAKKSSAQKRGSRPQNRAQRTTRTGVRISRTK